MTLLDTIKSLLGLDDDRSEERRPERSRTAPARESEDAVKGTGADEPAAAGGDAAGSTESIVDEDAEGGAEPGEVTGSASSESGGDPAVEEGADADESAAAGGDAAASTGSMTEENGSEGAAEPGEAVGPTDDTETDDEMGNTAADESGVNVGDEAEADEPETEEVGDGTADEAAAAGSDASGSTGSITEETNESISAAEDAEAAGPTDADPGDDAADNDVDALKGIGPSYAERLGEAGIENVADLADADAAAIAEEIDVAESRVERWSERARARRQ